MNERVAVLRGGPYDGQCIPDEFAESVRVVGDQGEVRYWFAWKKDDAGCWLFTIEENP